MQRPLLLALLALASLLPTPAGAQEEAPLVEDPSGDVALTANGVPVQGVATADVVDLLALRMAETPAEFHFEVEFAAVDPGVRMDAPMVTIEFVHDHVRFVVFFYRPATGDSWTATLNAQGEGDAYPQEIGTLALFTDPSRGLVWTDVARQGLTGASGRVPGRGDTLEGIFVTAKAHNFEVRVPVPGGVGVASVTDRAPDGDGAATWTVQHGGREGHGSARLESADPFRASNGGEDRLTYLVTALNAGQGPASYRLTVEGVPEGWTVTLPGATLDVPAGRRVQFPVVVQTRFFHQHGATAGFQLHMHDLQDPSNWAALDLGIHYLSVPQPAGHHDTVYLHAHNLDPAEQAFNGLLGGQTGSFTMNTQEEDAGGDPGAVPGRSGPTGTAWTWSACLDPALRLGLDFDLARTGSLEMTFTTTAPASGTLEGRLLLLRPGPATPSCAPEEYGVRDSIVLAELEGDAPIELDAQGEAAATATLHPTREANLVRYQKGAQLVLELSVATDRPVGAGGLALVPGARMALPLDEYLEDNATFATDADPAPYFAPSPQERRESPAAGLGALAIALAGAAGGRRRKAADRPATPIDGLTTDAK